MDRKEGYGTFKFANGNIFEVNVSHNFRKHNFGHGRSAKIQISQHICAV